MTTEPTDVELQQLWQNSNPTNFEAISFARAVLQRWGQPSGAGEPVATIKSWTNGSYCRNYKVEWYRNDLPEGTQLYTTPQPTQPQAGAVPLSIAEEERMLAQWDYEMHGDRARYIEAAHGIGIKGGQHGTE